MYLFYLFYDRLTSPFLSYLKTFSNAVTLFSKKGKFSMAFSPVIALNSFFYKTQYYNLRKFGRMGISNILGNSTYPLSRLFHLSIPALFLYTKYGALCVLTFSLFWVFNHLFWIALGVDFLWCISIVFILLFSTSNYYFSFSRMNYQIIGWSLLPVLLIILFIGDSLSVALFYLLIVSLSITAGLFSLFLIICNSPSFFTFDLFYCFIFIVPLLFLRLYPLVISGDLFSSFKRTLYFIGTAGKSSKYSRSQRKFGKWNKCFFLLYSISLYILYSNGEDILF